MMRLLLICFLFFSSSAWSLEVPTAWKYIPVVHEGRTLHLKTFAGLLTEEHNIVVPHASDWLFETIFSPESSLNMPAISITNAEAVSFLGLEARANNLYSAKELPTHFLAAKERIEQLEDGDLKTEIQNIQRTLNLYYDLSESFTPFFAFANLSWNDIPEVFHPRDINTSPSFSDLLRHRADIKQTALDAVAAYGTDFTTYPQYLQKVAYLSFAMDSLAGQGRSSRSLRIVPDLNGDLISPWQSILNAEGTPARRTYFETLSDAVTAYAQEDQNKLNSSIQKLAAGGTSPKLHAESLYHAAKPLTLLIALSILGIILSTASLLRCGAILNMLSHTALWGMTSLLTFTLLARMYILGRPPVGTLFESILFVACVCLGFALYKGWQNNKQVQLTAFVSSFLLFILASAMAETSAAMPLLTAVLNTQFWLTVHVLCITTGYAVSLLTALAAHGALLTNNITLVRVRTLAVWAVFFTLVGTLLGGVWADQSWGRFWGWDPKENGALLLVLWLAWCLHLPYSIQISKKAQQVCFAATTIIVALSWFGVNLLGVGLHSYGFTEGIAVGLISFVAVQICLLAYLYYRKTSHEA
ncbi:MAG: cytochrome c biogenesis protein CcsA [Pseudomonadota bacterium]|nr:cytochrome c biogenesis protein CcsA [Pseudomonadota bacterium]